MRLGGVPRVRAVGQRLPDPHPVPVVDPERAGPQVREGEVRAPRARVVAGEDEMVARDGRHTPAQPVPPPQRPGHEGESRTRRGMVDLPVVHRDDDPAGRHADRPPEGEKPPGRLGGEQAPPVPEGRGAVPLVAPDEVDAVARPVDIDAVAGHPPRGAVVNYSAVKDRVC